MRTIFSRKKNTKATRNGFSEYSEIVKQDGTRDVLPNVPVSDYSSIDELIHSLQIKTIDFGPEDQLLLFGAIADDEGRKAGILLSDAKPWLTGYGSQKISYDRLAEWIRQNDRAHLLFDGYSHAGYDNSVSGILHQLCDILQTLSDHKIIPEFTFRIFRDYVHFNMEITRGHFYDRFTGKEISPEEACGREIKTRAGWIRSNMDRCGESPERIQEALEQSREEIQRYYDEITSKPVPEGTLLAFFSNEQIPYPFAYSGEMFFYPNTAGTSGYGSDDWMYLCCKDDEDFILSLSYGEGQAVWSCLPIPAEGAAQIRKTAGEALLSVYHQYWNQDLLVLHLHPENPDIVRKIVVPGYHRTGKLTDEDLYGI